MQHATYRKHNDRSLNSSTYHKKDGTAIRAILKEELHAEAGEDSILANVYESYERNGDGFVMFNTEEAAQNHSFFEVAYVVKTQVFLSPQGYAELMQGKPIF